MKILKTLAVGLFLVLFAHGLSAQPSSGFASQQAILYADSLQDSFKKNDISRYLGLSYPGVVSYYGGMRQFREYVQRARVINSRVEGEPAELCELQQITNIGNEWQCVIRKTRFTEIEDRNAKIVSYLVGQSTDDGRSWKFFDVAFSSKTALGYIMPDMFSSLSIPQRQIIYGEDHLVSY